MHALKVFSSRSVHVYNDYYKILEAKLQGPFDVFGVVVVFVVLCFVLFFFLANVLVIRSRKWSQHMPNLRNRTRDSCCCWLI